MDITAPEVTRVVGWWARAISKNRPSLEACDVAQELWVEVINAREKYDPEKHASFPTYIWQRCKWVSLSIARNYKTRLDLDNHIAALQDDATIEQTESLESVISRVRGQLPSVPAKVFDIMINPPGNLVEFARALSYPKNDLSPDSRTVALPMDSHIACYLGLPTRTMERAVRQIKDVLYQEVHSDQRKGRKKKSAHY